MKKPTDKFFEILSEAVKKRNPYGVNTSDKEANPFFKPLKLEKDYSYHGEYKEIPDKVKSERNKLYKKEDLAGIISLRNKKSKELQELEEIQKVPLLFGQKGELEKRKTTTLQRDLIELSKEIVEIKNTYTTYPARLTQMLKTFFTVPGANMAKRYIILPLKRNININDINKLNLDRSKTGDMLNSLLNNKEIIVDRETDGEIKKYLTSFGYHFKDDNDLYNDICYTSNGAKIKITDEFAKINKIDVVNKKKFIDKTTDVIKREQAMNEVRKKENLTDKFMARMDLINTETIKNENTNDINVVVITWIPRLIMSQSTTTIWSSCMKLQDESGEGGVNKHYIPGSIENGVFIAWLVNIKDIKTINKPLARILIKPFVVKGKYLEEQNEMADFIWWASDMYHDGSNSADIRIFASCVKNFCYRKQYKMITNVKKKLNDNFVLQIQKDQYSDNSDKVIDSSLNSVKDIYNNIQNGYGERDFFNATDYSDKKMFFYLKKINPKKIEFYLERMLSRSLETNNLSAFDYLSKINKKKTDEMAGAYLAFFCTKEDPYRYTFITYLLKYYYQDIRRQDKDYFIEHLFQSTKHDDVKDFIYKEKKILIDFLANNGPKNNYSFLAKIFPYFGPDFIKKNNAIENILNVINKNNIISLFEINKESQEDACNLFFYFDSMYEKMNQDLQKEYDAFYNTIKKSINDFFINKYLIKSVSFSSNSKVSGSIRIRKNCFEFMKIGKEKNITPHNVNKNFMMSVDVTITENSKKIDSEFFNKLVEYGYITDDIATDYNNITHFLSKIGFENFKKYFELYVSSLKALHSNMFFDLLSEIACDRSMTEESRNKKIQYIYEKYSHVMNKEDTSRLIFVYYLPTITNEIDYDFISSLLKKYNIEMDNENILTVIRSYKKDNILFVKNISDLMNLAKLKKLTVKDFSTDSVLTNYIFNNGDYYNSPVLATNYKYFISILDIDDVIKQMETKFENMDVNLIRFLFNTYLIKILFKDGKLKKNKKVLDIIMRAGVVDISQYPECLESFRYVFDDDYEKTVDFLINDSSYTVEHSIFKINQIFNIDLNDFKNSKAFQKMIDEIKNGMLKKRESYVYKKYDINIFDFNKFFAIIKEENKIKFFEDNFEKFLIENDRLYLCFHFIRVVAEMSVFHKTDKNQNHMNEKFIEYSEIMREEKENYNNYYAFLNTLTVLVDNMNIIDFDDVFEMLSFCKMIIAKKENGGKKVDGFTDFIHNFEYVKTIFLRRNSNRLTDQQKIEIDKA